MSILKTFRANQKVQGIILNFSNHPCILKIKEKFQVNKRFSFQHVSEATERKVVKNLPSDKVSAGGIPIEILKESKFCCPKSTNCINASLTNNRLLDTLKLSNITPVFKKLDPSDKANYRPVSILPSVSKVFKKIMNDQLYEYIENFLSQLLLDSVKQIRHNIPFSEFYKNGKKSLSQGGLLVQF